MSDSFCDPVDCSLPDSSVHGIFQGRILEWVTISFSERSSWSRNIHSFVGKAQGFSVQCYWYWGPDDSLGGGGPCAQQGIDQHPDPYPLDRCLERSPSITTTGNVSNVVKCALQSKMTPSWGPLVQLKSQRKCSRDCTLLTNLLSFTIHD